MTRDSLKLPSWAIPLLVSAIVTLAVAWSQLNGTESASAHTADVVALQGAIKDVKNDAEKKAIRDSAAYADMTRILLDIQRQVKK